MGERVDGDRISAEIGDDAKAIAVGKDIRQTDNRVTFNNNNDNDNDNDALWRAIATLDMRLTILEHETRANARQYYIAIILFIVVIASLWYLSMKIDSYTKTAQNLSRVATEQKK